MAAGSSLPSAEPSRLFLALHEVAVAIGGVLDPAELARLAAERARTLLATDGVGVYIWHEDEQLLRPLYTSDPSVFLPELTFVAGQGIVGRAFRERRTLVVEDYAAWQHALPPSVARGVRSAAAVPLLVGDRALGTLVVRSYRPHAFSGEEERALALLAALVAPALEAARLYRESQEELGRHAALLRVARRFATETESAHLLEGLLVEATRLLGGEDGVVRRWDPVRGGLAPLLGTFAGLESYPVFPGRQGVSGRALAERRPVIENNYQREIGDESPATKAGVHAGVAAPLLHEGRVLGTISVLSRDPAKRFTSRDADVLEVLAGLASATLVNQERTDALAAANRKLDASLRELQEARDTAEAARQRVTFLATASAMLGTSLDYEATLSNVVHLAVPTLADWCSVNVLNEHQALRPVAVAHVDEAQEELAAEMRRRFPRVPDPARSPVGRVLATGQPVLIARVTDALLREISQNEEHFQLWKQLAPSSVVIVPLLAHEHLLGSLSLIRTRSERPYEQADLDLAEEVARRCALAIENARLYRSAREELMERTRAEQALRASEERFRALVRSASDVIAVLDRAGVIQYASPAAETVWGRPPETLQEVLSLDLVHPDDRPAADAFLEQVRDRPGSTLTTGIRLQHVDGTWRDFEVIANNLLADPAVAGIVATFRDVTERRAFEHELTRLAFHDPLSNLANRSLFTDRLERALARADRHGHRVAVLFLDLDNFKVINDSLGHVAGDQVLAAVARRISDCLRGEDTAARLGGDEFTVLLEEVANEQEAIAVAQRIVATLQHPIPLEGREVYAAASIGIALSGPSGDRPDDLLRNADLAMYRAKTSGKARYEVFAPRMNQHALERLELETGLRHALPAGELRVYYQPILSFADGRIVELEALVRWAHPQRGLVLPEQFIPLAEETGLIVPIGQWILETACREACAWQRAFPADPPLAISVNLSARQLQHPLLIDEVWRTLGETGVDPSTLTLEITESVLMQNAEATVTKLRDLKGLGVRLAIDDFGTGYSSLGYLKHFPVDTLKIDRSFVDGIDEDAQDAAIVRSIVAVAKALNLSVTAEGVETARQQQLLNELGCDRGQGFYFAKPAAPDAVSELLAHDAARHRLRPAA